MSPTRLIVCELQRAQARPGSRMRNFTIYLLSAQSERGGSDARWQAETLDDFLPELLVDYLDETASLDHQVVELVQIQHGLGHDGQTIDWLTYDRDNSIDLINAYGEKRLAY